MKRIVILLFGLFATAALGAPVEEGCEILPFEKSIFEDSLLLDNHFMCPSDGPVVGSAQFCEHLYKCPLDFSGKTRHCAAVCKRDGTWDYKYPSCEDVIPLANEIITALEINPESEIIIPVNEGGMEKRVKRWDLELVETKTTLPPTEPPKTTPGSKRVTRSQLHAACQPLMCKMLKSERSCKGVEKITREDLDAQMKFCRICVMIDACKQSIRLLSSG